MNIGGILYGELLSVTASSTVTLVTTTVGVDTVLTGTRRAIAINLWAEEPYSSKMNIFETE